MNRLLRPISLAASLFAVACSQDGGVTPPRATSISAPIHRNSALAPSDVRTIFGPQVITRQKGSPVTQTFTLSGYAPGATLHVVSGAANGSNRVTSGTISLDGVDVIRQSDFNPHVATIDRSITLRNTSTLAVRLTGSPGDYLTLSIDGALATSATAGGSTASEVHLLGNQVTLALPAHATAAPLAITSAPIPAPSAEAVPGTTIDLGPSGTQFSVPVTLSIAFDPAALPRGARAASLHLNWWNADHWEALPNNSVDLVHGVVSAQTTHFSTFALLPNEVEFCQSDPASEPNLATAISHVPAAGTVFVCDGRQTANEATIDRPVTVAAEHAGLATIAQSDTAVANMAVLRVSNVPSGTIALTNLIVQSRFVGLWAEGAYDRLNVTGTTFAGTDTSDISSYNVRLRASSVGSAAAVFDHDTFTGASHGLSQEQPIAIDVFHSTFHDVGSFGLIIQTANGTQNPSPFGTPVMRVGRVEWNTFTNCGAKSCLALEQAGMDTVRFNQIAMNAGSVTDAILINRAGQPAALTVPNVVSDNVVGGHGPGADSTIETAWGVAFGLRVLQDNQSLFVPGFADVVERNTIDGAFVGLDVRAPRAIAATDNRVANTYAAINYVGPTAPIVGHRNDFVGYHYPIATNMASTPLVVQSVAPAVGSLTCNYWGTSNGPAGVLAGTTLTSYTPFSSVPIAGVASVSCDPDAVPTTIRACATPGGGLPTVATIQEAYAAVPAGGTIVVCDGTFTLNNFLFQKPLTVRAEGPGMPTLDAGTASRVLGIGPVAGDVTLTGLRLTGGTTGVMGISSNVTGIVTLRGNEFHAKENTPPSFAAGIIATGTGINTVTVDQNTFVGGDVGFFGGNAAGATMNITANTFTSQLHYGVFISSSFDGTYTIDGNTFTNCGGGGTNGACIQTSLHTSITNNSITYDIAHPTPAAIRTIMQATDLQPTIIADNVITGTGSGPGARTLVSTYPIQSAAIQAQVAGSVIVTGNHITNAANGIQTSGAATVNASDNTVTHTLTALVLSPPSAGAQLVANWNDLTDYVTAVSVGSSSPGLGGLNIRCNYWGSATGPSPITSLLAAATYTPFAPAPIAGQSHVSCVP